MLIEEKAARVETNGPVEEKEPGGGPALDSIIPSDIKRFAALFCGLDRSYGVYNAVSSTPDEKGKLIGSERITVAGPLCIDLYKAHLAGKSGLGVVPIMSDNMAQFGAVDLDIYNDGLSHDDLVKKLQRMGLPLIVCRSKSGGAHCYLFAAEPVPAALMVNKLNEIAAMIGHADSEIFPKQKTIRVNEAGSWINLPYFNGMMAARYAVGPDGAMSPGEFLAYAESLKQSTEWFHKPLVSSIELPQGPPCLQHLVQIGFPSGTRNNGLFNLGVYCRKADPDGWKPMLEGMNRKFMLPQLQADEVQGTIKSVGKKAYFYTCDQQPLAAHCNKTICSTRLFGIGAGNGLPDFGILKKIETDPVTWIWNVNGLPLTLNTDQLLDPFAFQKACADQLTICVNLIKREKWTAVVMRAMAPENVVIQKAPEDVTIVGQFKGHVECFCTSRAQAHMRDEIIRGLPWDDGDGFIWFQIADLFVYLERKKFRIESKEVYRRLKEIGATPPDKQTKIKGKQVSLWKIPSFAKQTEGHDVPSAISEDRPF